MNKISRTALAACAAMLPLTLVAMRPDAQPHPVDAKAFTGNVSGWAIDASGTVSVRLEGKHEDGAEFLLWFQTAPNRTTTTNFEELVLQAVLHQQADQDRPFAVTVTAEMSNEESGEKIEDAITFSTMRCKW